MLARLVPKRLDVSDIALALGGRGETRLNVMRPAYMFVRLRRAETRAHHALHPPIMSPFACAGGNA